MRNAGVLALGLVLLASTLVVAAGPNPGAPAIRVEGVITAIDAEALQIVVSDLTVQITPNTVITMGGTVLDFEDLSVGMTAMVCGVMDGEVLKANKINVKYQGK